MEVALDPEPQGFAILARYLEVVGRSRQTSALYRGHADSRWHPIPSAFRPAAAGIINQDQLERWSAMAGRLANPKPRDDLHSLVLAQHYGIPTPLLDWTSNPLTALFFACQSAASDVGGQVLQVPFDSFEFMRQTLLVELFNPGRQKPALFDTSAMNVRSTAQDSYMSLHSAQNECFPLPKVVFEVSAMEKIFALYALKVLGLSPERIYADMAVAATEFRSFLMVDHLMRIGQSHEGAITPAPI